MPLPRVAIVGRPNVGKSSLLNLLAKERVSIVDPTPGVTRDRVTSVVELMGPLKTETPRLAEVIDTGGYGIYTAEDGRYNEIGVDLEPLSHAVEEQIAFAVRESDLILFVLDTQAGITSLDETFASLLRERLAHQGDRDVPIIVIANKCDGENWEPHAFEFSALGFGEPILVSAKNKFRRRVFLESIFEALPELSDDAPEAEPVMRLALVGKRNAGKSTFVNALAGEQRVIVSEIAGTTRDAVDVRFEFGDRVCMAIDTAGVRKRKSIPDRIEWFARDRALRSIERADVVLMLIDATQDVSQIDKQLTQEIHERFKPSIIVVNKWDLAEGQRGRKGIPVTPEDYLKYLAKELRGLPRSPIVFTSATEGRGLMDVVELAFELHEQAQQRISTSELNRLFRDMLTERGPSSKLGRRAKVYYVTQVATQPPTIVLVVNDSNLFETNYQRYMLNRIAERTVFAEVPVRLVLRDRRRVTLQGLFEGEHKRGTLPSLEEMDDEQLQGVRLEGERGE
ncbi:MAG: ribosome biogenesis GTPase Der [Phycisphaerales bacterium JB043]